MQFSREMLSSHKDSMNEEQLRREIQEIEKKRGGNSKLLIPPLNELYCLYDRANNYSNGLKVKERIIQLFEAHDEGDSLPAAYAHKDAGIMLMRLQNAVGAEKHFREALSVMISVLGTDDPDSCRARIDLAGALRLRKRNAEASELVETAVTKIFTSVGGINMDTADVEDLAGDFYYFADEMSKAYNHFLSACSIYRQILGDKHVTVSRCLINMARCAYFSGDYQSSVKFCQEAIAIFDANPHEFYFVFEYPWVIISWAYQKLGRFEEA